MFVNVEVTLPKAEVVIGIPASGISYAPYGNSVFVLEKTVGPDGEEQKIARPRTVQTGRRRGDQIAIVSGLKVGEEVVTSGIFKVMPNAPVFVNNSVMPGDDLNPKPADT